MLISIYIGTMYCKWTGDELQASVPFLMTSIIFSVKTNLFQIYNYYITLGRQLYAD